MTNELTPQRASALVVMADRAHVEADKLLATLKATVFKGASNEELLALVVVANQYDLNPLLKEIYAFPNGKGGIVPLVPIDGWTKIVNRNPDFDGVEFDFVDSDNGKPHSCTAKMYSKNRNHPILVTEYYSECHRNTPPWNTMPRRMLRHKAYMQAARVAYGISGIFDEDEARDAIRHSEEQQPIPLKFGPAIPESKSMVETAIAEAAEDIASRHKRKRRTKAEMEAARAPAPEPEAEPIAENRPEDTPEPDPTPLVMLRQILLQKGIDEGKLHRYLVTSGYIEPSQTTLEKLDDAKLIEVIESLDSLVADMGAE